MPYRSSYGKYSRRYKKKKLRLPNKRYAPVGALKVYRRKFLNLQTHYYVRQYILPELGSIGTNSSWGQINTVPITALPLVGDMPGFIYARRYSQSINLGVKLSDCPDWTSIQGLYDSSKMLKAQFIFEPCYNSRDSNVNQSGYYSPFLNLYIRALYDYDDQFNPVTTESYALDYTKCKSFPVNSSKSFKLTLYPRQIGVMEQADTTATYRNFVMKPKWEDTSIPVSATGIGIKLYIPDFDPACFDEDLTKIPIFKVRVKLYFVSTGGK